MGVHANDNLLLLAATLIDSLPSSSTVSDTLLMQLHAVFGPMLLSALQLIDRREVVLVTLPGGREVYQVTSSSGQPYTLYTCLPPLLPTPEPPGPAIIVGSGIDRSLSPTPSSTDQPVPPRTPPPLVTERPNAAKDRNDAAEEEYEASLRKYEIRKNERIRDLAAGLERMYCPCAGFLFNSIGGERNHLCKHLLAVILAHQMDKTVQTEVYLAGVIELLNLNKRE